MLTIRNTQDDGSSVLTVIVPGHNAPLIAHSSHPNFAKITEAVAAAENGIVDEQLRTDQFVALFDVTILADQKFRRLSDRVTARDGHVYLDGDEVDSAVARQIGRFLEDDVEDWQPLVNFFERVQTNPDPHSREQLFEWLSRHDFTITEDGCLVGYKGVKSDGKGGLVSIHAGPAIVDGEPMRGNVPNAVGSTVEISRSLVHADPSVGCSTGLHVGTYEYAKTYSGQGALLRVKVDPRDVVSVPTDCNAQKVRVCRYRVEEIIDAKLAQPILWDDEPEESLDEDGPRFKIGDRVEDEDGDCGRIVDVEEDDLGDYDYEVEYAPGVGVGRMWQPEDALEFEDSE